MTAATGDALSTEVTAGQESLLLDDPFPTPHGEQLADYVASRCRCRPGCLTPIEPADTVVHLAGGWALADHAERVA